MQDEQLITSRLIGLGEYFGKEMSKAVLGIYIEALQPYDDQDIVAACTQAVRTLKFFPRVADFVEMIEGDPASRSAVAWAKLIKAMEDHGSYYSVRFDDGAIMSAVNAMGGWARVCEFTYEDLKYRQREFEALYRQYSKPGYVHPEKLIGFFEADNRSKGYLDAVGQPRNIEDANAARVLLRSCQTKQIGEPGKAPTRTTQVKGADPGDNGNRLQIALDKIKSKMTARAAQ